MVTKAINKTAIICKLVHKLIFFNYNFTLEVDVARVSCVPLEAVAVGSVVAPAQRVAGAVVVALFAAEHLGGALAAGVLGTR